MFVLSDREWIRGSRVQTRPGSMDFFQNVKILSLTCFGREVKPWVPWRRFTARESTSSRNWSLWAKFVGLFTHAVESDVNDLMTCYVKRVVKPKTNTTTCTRSSQKSWVNWFVFCRITCSPVKYSISNGNNSLSDWKVSWEMISLIVRINFNVIIFKVMCASASLHMSRKYLVTFI